MGADKKGASALRVGIGAFDKQVRAINITPLDSWIFEKTGGDIAAYQLKMLNETLKTAQKSVFYKKTLPGQILEIADIAGLPTIDAGVLTREGPRLVCVTQSEIERVVTLTTSGTTGEGKRVYFTGEDQELTLDFFAHGLPTLIKPGGKTAILLPCAAPGGVGDLIARALLRIPAEPVRFGFVSELESCAKTLRERGAEYIIGVPLQIFNLARYSEKTGVELKIRAVLLSTDNIPRIVVRELERIWGCEVFEHYGMTETGLGGAIDCEAHNGYHVRENDLYFEVLGEDGQPVADGEYGELAVTTLTRRAMPLIRYATGDIMRILPGRCACGSSVKRMAPIAGRIGGDVTMACGAKIRLREFDEVLLEIEQLSDFTVKAVPERDFLEVNADLQRFSGSVTETDILKKLKESGLINGLEVRINIVRRDNVLSRQGAKRVIAR